VRIDNKGQGPRRPQKGGGTESSRTPDGGGQSGGAAETGAHMDLDMPKLQAKLDALPEVRQGRVDALKDAIERGEYEVDGEEVVSRLLRNVLLDNLK